VRFLCIADEDTVRGFRLAGIEAFVAETEDQAYTAMNYAITQPDCGIVIITERAADLIRSKVDGIRLERNQPLIVEIPGPEGPLGGRKSLREFVQEAVGISVS